MSTVVCDDHLLFGESFGAALQRRGARVTVTACPAETLQILERAPTERVVMSLRFPDGRGLAATRQIRSNWPETHVFCSGAEHAQLVQSAIDAGARAVLSKRQPLAELVETVLSTSGAISRGGHIPEPRSILGAAARPRAGDQPLAARFLTNRERDVLRLLVSARSTSEIAEELGIRLTTTRGYVQSILAKLGVRSRVEAVGYAVRNSVVLTHGDHL